MNATQQCTRAPLRIFFGREHLTPTQMHTSKSNACLRFMFKSRVGIRHRPSKQIPTAKKTTKEWGKKQSTHRKSIIFQQSRKLNPPKMTFAIGEPTDSKNINLLARNLIFCSQGKTRCKSKLHSNLKLCPRTQSCKAKKNHCAPLHSTPYNFY